MSHKRGAMQVLWGRSSSEFVLKTIDAVPASGHLLIGHFCGPAPVRALLQHGDVV